ncbi:carotenoid 9,10(9, 10)-cleavage dioxygenase 1-like [Olea europaea subsp. europaea]|uniref:Carotenoid 9,10(9, 10)-cleavage dioxygenase 1-like n=1 Tax=Olea europaea subsp. europaea TaxID=158383 RepID=A0A8S0SNE0_OLEEU|nr:carotenoid 9,10(9, 10)-cleavage dioxygenase 1-like [Olea europaea subsp. europaea]
MFEQQVVMMVCRSGAAIMPGPDLGRNKFEWFSRGFKHINTVNENEKNPQDGLLFARAFEWRLNMLTGEVKEKYLTGTEFALDFPFINEMFTGLRNKYGYAQVVDSDASSTAGMPKFGGLAKLCLEERKVEFSSGEKKPEEYVKVEYHMLPRNTFCTGAAFVARHGSGATEEDDGWIVTFVHNEDTNISEVYIVDAKKFGNEPVAKIVLPNRGPYGFHGFFVQGG